jgi:parallel beta-helix repeat protein
MKGHTNARALLLASMAAIMIAQVGYSFHPTEPSAVGSLRKGRIVTVAQSTPANFVGSNNAALQKAADSLKPGDTLEIGPGTYAMDNSLFIPSAVSVRGTPGQTILRKSCGVESRLIEDGDYGESQLRVAEPQRFRPGMGISVTDKRLNSDWDISVTTVKSIEGNSLRIDPMTLRDYSAQEQQATVRNTFPILCAIETDSVRVENIIIDGNKAENEYIDGCRGGAIYLYRSKNATVRNCVARNYNGDGISLQLTDDVQILNCESRGHTGYGIHPGAGSAHTAVEGCHIRNNGVGLFLCWRVRDGRFERNLIESNREYGISIGHKDTDNVFGNNTISGNGKSGIYFRKETIKNSAHRNTFSGNKVLNNGGANEGYGFYIEPMTGDLTISHNQIMDTRAGKERTQRYGVYKAAGVGNVRLEDNQMQRHLEKDVFDESQKR